MRRSILTLAAATATGLSAGTAQALPVAPVPSMAADVTLAAGGCGPHRHRNHHGVCVHNRPYYYDRSPYAAWPLAYGTRIYGPGFYELGPHCVIIPTYIFGSIRSCR